MVYMMLQLKMTQKVQKELRLKPKDLSDVGESHTTLGDWFVNIFTIDRRKALVFMNEKTLFSFILYGVRKDNIQEIEQIFKNGFEKILNIEEVERNKINKLLDEYSTIKFTKTDSKTLLGNMNDLTDLYKHKIKMSGGLQTVNLTEIITKTNRTPQRKLGWSYSIDMLKELLV